jgi:hypothetical protein
MSIRSLLVLFVRFDNRYLDPQVHLTPHRFAASLIVSLLWEIFVCSLPVDVNTCAEDKTDVRFGLRFAGQPFSIHVPVKVPQGLSGAQMNNTGNATREPAPSQPVASLPDDLKDGTRPMRTVVYDEARQLSRRKNSRYDGPEVRACRIVMTLMHNRGS